MTCDQDRINVMRRQLMEVVTDLHSAVWDLELLDPLDESAVAILKAKAVGALGVALDALDEASEIVTPIEE